MPSPVAPTPAPAATSLPASSSHRTLRAVSRSGSTTPAATPVRHRGGRQLVYLGGHQRWLNNAYAGDTAGPGAVSREGMAVSTPATGCPTPGTRAVPAALALASSYPDDGLWIAHDTNRLGRGDPQAHRFLPVAGGTPIPDDNTGSVPGDAYSLGTSGAGGTNGSSRVNTGGGAPCSPPTTVSDWVCRLRRLQPVAVPQQQRQRSRLGNLARSPGGQLTAGLHAEASLFNSEPVGHLQRLPQPAVGLPGSGRTPPFEVRLFFSNRYAGTAPPGQRIFDVSPRLAGPARRLRHRPPTWDTSAGTMKQWDLTSRTATSTSTSITSLRTRSSTAIEIIRHRHPAGWRRWRRPGDPPWHDHAAAAPARPPWPTVAWTGAAAVAPSWSTAGCSAGGATAR